jgi:hypothetical protein
VQEFIQDFAGDGPDAIFDRMIRGAEHVTRHWRGNLNRRRTRNRNRGRRSS